MTKAVEFFNKKSFSYTYTNNNWSFTNYFEGTTRISEMEKRGTLNETVAIEQLSEDIYFIAWENEEMGPISQVVDFKQQLILASIPWEGSVEIWPAKITGFVDGRIES